MKKIPKKYRDRLPERINILVHRRKEGGLFGICLDFNIAAETSDTDSDKLADRIFMMCISHVHNVITRKLSPSLLARKAEKKYWDILKAYLTAKAKEIGEQKKQMEPKFEYKWEIETYEDKSLFNIQSILNGSKELVFQGV